MDAKTAAERLLRAEREWRAAQLEHDGTLRATVRYRAALDELRIAWWVAEAVLEQADEVGGSDVIP